MVAKTILVLHTADDAKDAYRLAAALSAEASADTDIRPVLAQDGEDSRDAASATHIVLMASASAVASLSVSQALSVFLEHGERENVFPVVSSMAAGSEPADALISPLLTYRRTSDDALLERVTTPVSVAGDLRTESARAVARRLAPHIAGADRFRGGLAIARRLANRPGLGWGVAASLAVFACLAGVIAFERGQRVQNAELAAHQARLQTSQLLAELEDTLSPDARSEVFGRLGEDVISLAQAGSLTASDADISRFAQLLHVVGEARRESNDVDGALAAFTAAAGMTGQLLAALPGDGQRIFDHAQSVFWIGELGLAAGRYDIAAQQFAEYERLAAQLIALDPDNPVYRGEWAYAQVNSGAVDLEFDNWDGALARFDLAVELFRDGLIDEGIVSETSLANTYGWSAVPLRSLGRLTEAAQRRRQEIDILAVSLAENPDSRMRRNRMLTARTALAILYMDLGDIDAAEAEIAVAVELARDLSAEWPDNRSILREHLALKRQQARLALWRGDLVEAQLINGRARREFASSASAEIDDHRYVDAAYFDLLAAEIALAAGADEAALLSATSALVNFERDVNTTGSRLRHFAAAALLIQGQAFEAGNDTGEAERAWRAGLAHIEAMPEPRDLRAEDYRARLLRELGRRDAAEAIQAELAASEYNRPDFQAFWMLSDRAVNTASTTPSEDQDG